MAAKGPFHIVIEKRADHEPWWWRVENSNDHLVNHIGYEVMSLDEPDGHVLRGTALTRHGAQRKAKRKLAELRRWDEREANRNKPVVERID